MGDDSDRHPTRSVVLRRRAVVAGGAVLVLVAGAVSAVALMGRDGGQRDAAPVAAPATPEAEDVADDERAEAERVAEEERAAEAEREEQERAEAERVAEEERAAEAEREEQERAEAERAAEEERLADERAAEEARLAEERAEEERRAAEEEARRFVEAQERLRELGYLVGAADGEAGQQTTSAVMAFQAVNGLTVDGALGPATYAALDAPRQPSLRGGAPTRIEVDMDRQVLHLVERGSRVTTMKVSTGRGGTFQSQDGQTLRAETPIGTFTIDRRIAGEKPSSYGIGSMWDPMYFHGPWAIHGSPTVPAGPASSGCVRVAMADGRWLFDRVPNGTPVVLYGGTHVFTP